MIIEKVMVISKFNGKLIKIKLYIFILNQLSFQFNATSPEADGRGQQPGRHAVLLRDVNNFFME